VTVCLQALNAAAGLASKTADVGDRRRLEVDVAGARVIYPYRV
jgi:hypothetical protein